MNFSFVDKELSRESKARYRFRQKKKQKQGKISTAIIKESAPVPNQPKRRSKRSITCNRSALANLREINEDYVWTDENGVQKLRFWKGVVPKTLLSGVLSSTRSVMRDLIQKNEELKASGKVEKLRDNTLHFGTWPDYQPYFFITKETRVVPKAVSFLENKCNRELINWLTEHFRKNFNDVYEEYCNLNVPDIMRLIGRAFPTMALNYGTALPHYDMQDKKDGIAYLINYGSFEGGELVFRDLKLKFKFEPGDLIAFDGRSLYHENLPARGERYSMVLFGHQCCFTK